MRLLNTSTVELEEFQANPPIYAILSHTWEEEEVLFADMQNGSAKYKKGYGKVWQCCQLAAKRGYEYVWIDTCCIDKSSSAELSEAINSMFGYYESAQVCIAYLDIEVPLGYLTVDVLRTARWMYRGWTLQELVVPFHVHFYDRNWDFVGTREDNCDKLAEVSKIDRGVLEKRTIFDSWTVAERMSWAAGRQTTRPEDIAYCLFGIFNVNLPPLYGEGRYKAFRRLQEEIMKSSQDLSILAWPIKRPFLASNTDWIMNTAGALAISPDCFILDILYKRSYTEIDPFSLTNKGLRLKLPLIIEETRDDIKIGTLVLPTCVSGSNLSIPMGIRVSTQPNPRGDFGVFVRYIPTESNCMKCVYPVDKERLKTAVLSKIYLQA